MMGTIQKTTEVFTNALLLPRKRKDARLLILAWSPLSSGPLLNPKTSATPKAKVKKTILQPSPSHEWVESIVLLIKSPCTI